MGIMWAPLRFFEHTGGPHQFLDGHQMGPIKIPSTKRVRFHMHLPDRLNNYIGTKGVPQVALNNNMGMALASTRCFHFPAICAMNKPLQLLSNSFPY